MQPVVAPTSRQQMLWQFVYDVHAQPFGSVYCPLTAGQLTAGEGGGGDDRGGDGHGPAPPLNVPPLALQEAQNAWKLAKVGWYPCAAAQLPIDGQLPKQSTFALRQVAPAAGPDLQWKVVVELQPTKIPPPIQPAPS